VRNVIYEDNVIENNAGAGIDHEISWNAVIRNNTIRNNNTAEQGQRKSCWYGAQIAINNSQTVTISGNLIEAAGSNAICLANTTRHESAWFPQFLADIVVKGNTIKMRGALSSARSATLLRRTSRSSTTPTISTTSPARTGCTARR
jgi:parallel beta-helix repeat protein